MELITEERQESRIGNQEFTLEAGKTLKIETSPDGEELLDFTADKQYTVRILVHMTD